MSHQPQKIHSFLEELSNAANSGASSEEREKAARKLADMLRNRKIYVIRNNNDLQQAAAEIMAAKARLEEIKARLEALVKAGGASSSLH